jgi:hypothetical protein
MIKTCENCFAEIENFVYQIEDGVMKIYCKACSDYYWNEENKNEVA